MSTSRDITGKELADKLGLDFEKTVKPYLSSLYLAKKCNLLTHGVSPDGKKGLAADKEQLKEGTTFWINPSFTRGSKKFTAPILTPRPVQTDSQGSANHKMLIDACTVRVMKTHGTLKYDKLLEVVMTRMQQRKLFTPERRHIKMRIEDLIVRKYLSQSEDRDTLKYVV